MDGMKTKMEVDRIHKIENGKNLKAYADIKIADSFLVKGLRVVEGENGLFVGMPQNEKDGKYYENVRPLSKEIREEVNSVVIKAYEE